MSAEETSQSRLQADRKTVSTQLLKQASQITHYTPTMLAH